MRGITFAEQEITSADMAHYMYVISQKKSGVTKGLLPTYSGTTLYIGTGRMMICGRQIAVEETESIEAPEVTSGTIYCRLVCEVDLSKTNTTSEFLQGEWKILQSSDGYPSLIQQNLDDNPGDGVYQLPIAKFTAKVTGIANFVDERQQFDVWLTATIPAGSTSVTINDPSITANSFIDDYYSKDSVVVTNKTVSAGRLTITIKAMSAAVNVKVRVF